MIANDKEDNLDDNMTEASDFPPIIVLHVRNGYEARAAHIDSMLARLGLNYEYMLDGDISDLSPELIRRWFAPGSVMSAPSAVTSCTMKHLYACMSIIDRGLPGAVVLEDDIALRDDFRNVVEESLAELPEGPAIISYEDTRLRFVPYSMRRPGKVLYPGDRDRFAGAYYINAAGARAILDAAAGGHIDRPIDLYHRMLLDKGKLRYWWTHPCVATQGSFNGLFASTLSPDRGKAVIWKVKRLYRKALYRLR